MRVFLTPQFNENEYITYMFSEEKIKAEKYVLDEIDDIESEHQESDKEYKLSETLYYDFSNIETQSTYIGDGVISNIKRDDIGMLHIELLNPLKEDSPEEFRFPEWFDVEFEDFEIPEDAEIIQIEELIIPEPEPSPVDSLKAENYELRQSMQSLRDSMVQGNKNTEDLIVTLLSMM